MDEEKLFKTVFIAQCLGTGPGPGESCAHADRLERAIADADKWWNKLQEFRGMVSQFVEIESTSPSSVLRFAGWCGLCDSAHCTGHSQLRCERCGVKGLAENMTTERHKCRVDRIQQEPWLTSSGHGWWVAWSAAKDETPKP